VYAESAAAARGAYTAFERKWRLPAPGWSAVSRRAGTNCSPSSSSTSASGRRSGPRTSSNASTRSSAGA
jgi:hypothetical protein